MLLCGQQVHTIGITEDKMKTIINLICGIGILCILWEVFGKDFKKRFSRAYQDKLLEDAAIEEQLKDVENEVDIYRNKKEKARKEEKIQ